MAYNQYDLQNTSLVKTGILTEMYIPLWWYSSGSAFTTTTNNANFVQKGSNGASTSITSMMKLHTLNANWASTQQFCFEASIFATSGGTVYSQIYDVTSSSVVSGSQISTTSTTPTVLRSGKFTLTPGHVYAVALYSSSTSYNAYLTKASLVAFLN